MQRGVAYSLLILASFASRASASSSLMTSHASSCEERTQDARGRRGRGKAAQQRQAEPRQSPATVAAACGGGSTCGEVSDEAAPSDEVLLGTAPLGLRPDVRCLAKPPRQPQRLLCDEGIVLPN